MEELCFKFKVTFSNKEIEDFLLEDLRLQYLGDDIKNIELVKGEDTND